MLMSFLVQGMFMFHLFSDVSQSPTAFASATASESSHDTGADVWVDICTIPSSLQMGAVGAYFLVGWWLLVHDCLSVVTLNANRHR